MTTCEGCPLYERKDEGYPVESYHYCWASRSNGRVLRAKGATPRACCWRLDQIAKAVKP